jgi:hypothetical protein
MNDMTRYLNILDDIEPWQGTPPVGFYADWLGSLTDAHFRAYKGLDPSTVGGTFQAMRRPTIEDGEGWFEAVNQVEAARASGDRFTMITLGACYGAQAVGSHLALKKINPSARSKLVAVEPEPVNLQWVARHMADNGIDPDDQWLVGSAISDTNKPVFFPVGAPGSGAQNCYSTNEDNARKNYVQDLIDSGRTEEALRNLLLHNTTGLTKDLVPGSNMNAEITVMSAVTLADVLAPFEMVDFLEVDIQQSEVIVFPPYMDLVTRKVRRVHIGTHGMDAHLLMVQLFRSRGWEVVFDFAPNGSYETSIGKFDTNDGVFSAVNPRLL